MFNKTKFFLGNTKSTDRNDVNEQYTPHIEGKITFEKIRRC